MKSFICHENKTVPRHLLIEGEKSNTDTLLELVLTAVSAAQMLWSFPCLEPQVFCAIWTNEGSNAGAVLEQPLGLSLCTHPCIFTFTQQVRSGSILLQRFLCPDNSLLVLSIVGTLFGRYECTEYRLLASKKLFPGYQSPFLETLQFL